MPRRSRCQHHSTRNSYDFADPSPFVHRSAEGAPSMIGGPSQDLLSCAVSFDDDHVIEGMPELDLDDESHPLPIPNPVGVRTVKMHVFSVNGGDGCPDDFPPSILRSSHIVCLNKNFDDYICSMSTHLREADCTYTDFHIWDRELLMVWAKYVDGFNDPGCCFGNHCDRLYPSTLGAALRSIDGNVGYAVAVMRKLSRDVQLCAGRSLFDRLERESAGGYPLEDILTICRIFRLYIDPYDQSLHVRVQPLPMRRSNGRRHSYRKRADKYKDVIVEDSEGSKMFPMDIGQLFARPAFLSRDGPYPPETTKVCRMRCNSGPRSLDMSCKVITSSYDVPVSHFDSDADVGCGKFRSSNKAHDLCYLSVHESDPFAAFDALSTGSFDQPVGGCPLTSLRPLRPLRPYCFDDVMAEALLDSSLGSDDFDRAHSVRITSLGHDAPITLTLEPRDSVDERSELRDDSISGHSGVESRAYFHHRYLSCSDMDDAPVGRSDTPESDGASLCSERQVAMAELAGILARIESRATIPLLICRSCGGAGGDHSLSCGSACYDHGFGGSLL